MKTLILLSLILSSSLVHATEITVFAASSLTNVLSRIGKNYQKKTGVKINFTFDSSSRLARQIHEGAKADLFFSADGEWNKFLEQKKNVRIGNTKPLLSNDLVLIAHKENKIPFSDLKTLLRISFKKLGISQETVPAGKYAYQSLKKGDVLEQIRGKIVNGDNVRNVLAWVSKNEIDYGIVYATDAKADSNVILKYSIPSEFHHEIIYPVSLIGEEPGEASRGFFEYLQGAEAKQEFEKAGFKWK